MLSEHQSLLALGRFRTKMTSKINGYIVFSVFNKQKCKR